MNLSKLLDRIQQRHLEAHGNEPLADESDVKVADSWTSVGTYGMLLKNSVVHANVIDELPV